jgi:hypothetical protein
VDGKLLYRRSPGNETELIPLGAGRFVWKGVPRRVEVAFEPGRMTFPGDDPPSVFRRVEPVARLDDVALGRYAGTFLGPELDATWTLAVLDGRLVLQ